MVELHNRIDRAVAAAYGWPADLDDESILMQLVALNRKRAVEEAQGVVRWLRPEFQNPTGAVVPTQFAVELMVATKPTVPTAWPSGLPDQMRAVRAVLVASAAPVAAKDVAAGFKGARAPKVTELLTTLAALGQARPVGNRWAA